MKTVFKYPISRRHKTFSAMVPPGFKFLCVQFFDEKLFMWAEVDKDATPIMHNFASYGTGHNIPDTAKHLTSYEDGPFMVHLYLLCPT